MIIMVQIFLRCLVHKVILRPKSKDPAKPLSTLNDTQKANLRLLASIIYYIVISVIKDVPIVPNNQSHLVEDEQFVAAPALQASNNFSNALRLLVIYQLICLFRSLRLKKRAAYSQRRTFSMG